jgi:hypothetical protein
VPKVRVLVAAAAVALVAAGAALADKEKIARTPAGNAQARAEVLRRADLGSGHWFGGFVKPDLSAMLPCSYQPKQSDLVLIGAAEATWRNPVVYEVDSLAEVLRTAAMVERDWRRTVVAPQVLPCLRQAFEKSLGSKARAISIRVVAFPRLAGHTRAFRIRAKIDEGSTMLPLESDFVALASGRNEVSLSVTAFGAATASLRADTLRLARALAHRMHS